MKRILSCCISFLLLTAISCYEEQQILVVADFDYSVVNNSYTVPVQLAINNRTAGADFYTWTFEGATPASSKEKQPGTIAYDKAGTYTIRLEAWNDTQRDVKEITVVLDSAVNLAFSTAIQVNNFAPAVVSVQNTTRGASTYEWTFGGGEPATSTEANPGNINFTDPGDHTITLRVTNGRETFVTSQIVTLKPKLATDFAIVPSFEDEDYEAPLTAHLDNTTVSALRYQWTASGGVITNSTTQSPDIHFDQPGDYTITLHTENDKDAQDVSHTIHVKPNTNLYTMTGVKLGISSAHNTVGCFYSTTLRDVLTKDSVNTGNGKLVDFAFFAINSGFTYCRFLSPDSAAKYTFPAIPGATHTYIMNIQKGISLTEQEFNMMTDDAYLAARDIRANEGTDEFFTGAQGPRVVLFETADGRRGAILITAFVTDAKPAYILADIKVQKEARHN